MSENADHIHAFIHLFDGRADEINLLVESDGSDTLKKILFATVLDGLNKVIAKSLSAKDDLSNFIVDYGGWGDAAKISLPHFRAALHYGQDVDVSSSDVKDLLEAVDGKYDTWMSTIDSPFNEPEDVGLVALRDNEPMQLHALSIQNDISDEWIKKFCDLEKVSSISNWFRHSSMLKKYRNCLIHESRQMGVKNRPERFDTPHYEHIGCVSPETNIGELYFNLVYPCDFLYSLTKQAVYDVEQRLLSENINPFDVWPKQEIYWIDEFNKNTLLPPLLRIGHCSMYSVMPNITRRCS